MKLVLVAHAVRPGGGEERVAWELVKSLAEGSEDVTVLAGEAECLPPTVRYVRLYMPRGPDVLRLVLFGAAAPVVLRWICRQEGAKIIANSPVLFGRTDVTIAHFCETTYFSKFGIRRPSARITSRLGNRLFSVVLRQCENLSYGRRARRIIAVSDCLAKELIEKWPSAEGRITVAPNGVDRQEFQPDRSIRAEVRDSLRLSIEDLAAVFVGGDWERKGLREAIEGVARTAKWHLVIVGDGDRKRYEAIARRLAVETRCHFIGRTPAKRFLQACDAYVSVSNYEAFSLALLEAAAVGLPLITTRTGGSEHLVSTESGVVIGRSGAEVAAALLRLEDAEVRRCLGENARELVRSYTWGYQAQEIAAAASE